LAATETGEGQPIGNQAGRQLSASQLALARGRAYGLLSQLYLAGVRPQTLPQVQAVPERSAELAAPFDADEAAADHHHLFGFNVHPYQSFFLDPAGLLGGPVTESVTRTYGNSGFYPETSSESADHIGFELGFLSFLCAAEAEALADDRPEAAGQWQERQREFMQTHLLRWIGPLTLAVDQQGHRFYRVLAGITFDVVQEHASGLSTHMNDSATGDSSLPPVPKILEDEKTGLKDIVDFLLTPAYSGIYLGRDDIGRLARQQAIPRGFGDRGQLLLNLLRAAANYGALGEVIKELESFTGRWLANYDELGAREGAGPFMAVWRDRAAGTAALLQQMYGGIEELA
jgi:TorA maturation chaperone TorD